MNRRYKRDDRLIRKTKEGRGVLMRNRFLNPFISLVILLCCSLFSVSYTQSQMTGRIIGKVTDKEGNILPGVTVEIQSPSMIGTRTAITNENGIYRFLDLPPGTYSIRIEVPGFMTQTLKDIAVRIGENTLVNITQAEILPGEGEKPRYKFKRPTETKKMPRYKIKRPTEKKESPPAKIEELSVNIKKIIGEEIDMLSSGKIMYNPPKEMIEHILERIEVRITKNINEDLIQGLKGRGLSQVEKIEVSSVMAAKLSGETFKIEPHSDEEQAVLAEGFTLWEWDVTPQEAGNRKLQLSISVVIHVPGFGERRKSFSVLEKDILVKVNPDIKKQRKIDWWKIIAGIGGIVGTIAAIFGIYVRHKHLKLARLRDKS